MKNGHSAPGTESPDTEASAPARAPAPVPLSSRPRGSRSSGDPLPPKTPPRNKSPGDGHLESQPLGGGAASSRARANCLPAQPLTLYPLPLESSAQWTTTHPTRLEVSQTTGAWLEWGGGVGGRGLKYDEPRKQGVVVVGLTWRPLDPRNADAPEIPHPSSIPRPRISSRAKKPSEQAGRNGVLCSAPATPGVLSATGIPLASVASSVLVATTATHVFTS